jgi:hypothetical protein
VRIAARRSLLPAVAAGVVLCVASAPALAVLCKSVSLKSASGVIGKKHSYSVSATCGQKSGEYGSGTSKNLSWDAQASGKASWDRASGVASETMTFSGTSSGKRSATAVCTQDPFLKNAPGGTATCKNFKVQADITSGQTFGYLIANEFWLSRGIALAEAQALSQQQPKPAEAPPPAKVPPPAKKKPGPTQPQPPVSGQGGATGPVAAVPSAAAQSAGKALNIEAELLTAPGKFQVNGGKVVMQPMVSFGSGWSGSRQLFWSGGATGAVLDLVVDIPASGTYAVELYLTRAPDYANLRMEIDGKPSSASFVGYAAKVTAPVPLQAGKFPLQAGPRRIAFMIVGKQQQSTNYFVGIDRIRLYPVGAK